MDHLDYTDEQTFNELMERLRQSNERVKQANRELAQARSRKRRLEQELAERELAELKRKNRFWSCAATGFALGVVSSDPFQRLCQRAVNAVVDFFHPTQVCGLPVIEEPYVVPPVETIPPVTRRPCAEPFMVEGHVRRLPSGWNVSPEKASTAKENGFELENGQTWVREYKKGRMED